MEDVAGIGQLADSEVVNRIYDEGLPGGVPEVGQILTDDAAFNSTVLESI